MNHKEIFDFPSFNGEHPYILSRNISIQNPYKVIAGYTSTSHLHDSSKHQISLGIEAVFHPNPLVLFVLIKKHRCPIINSLIILYPSLNVYCSSTRNCDLAHIVIPEFRNSIFIDYKRLKFNATEPMNENCESSYWLQTKHSTYKDNFFYEYLLMNEIPCPYVLCHYSNSTACTINKVIKVNTYCKLPKCSFCNFRSIIPTYSQTHCTCCSLKLRYIGTDKVKLKTFLTCLRLFSNHMIGRIHGLMREECNKNCISAMVVCNYHFMSFAEFEPEEGRSVLYHRITNETNNYFAKNQMKSYYSVYKILAVTRVPQHCG
ncbi:hypothetical protein AGLY_011297 [Aphis glycines]|uniref:Uncharacterized protein n=1 Tax=Aphis glycines TaxID=307491 RepID=A0A6G0TDY3_APHGL|nr:hypothetical protein AGLY_011297 [Aphis glycines]